MVGDTSSRTAVSRLVWLVVGMCLFAHSLAQQYPSGYCQAQNPLIRMLVQHKVKVFDTPQPATSKTCIAEWTTHSTCCEGSSLVKFAERDIKQLKRDMKDVKDDVLKMKDYIKKYEEKIEGAIKDSNLKDKKDFLEKLNKDLKNFRRELRSVLDKENKSEDEKDECFDRIVELRTASLCYTCSGRSAQFFLNDRAKISMADCRKTIDKCSTTWRKSIDLVDAIVLAKKIRKQLKEVIPKDELMDFEDNEIERFRNWIGSEDLRALIKECNGKVEDCSAPSAVHLCETFISFKKEGFTSDLGEMIEHQKQNVGAQSVPQQTAGQNSISSTIQSSSAKNSQVQGSSSAAKPPATSNAVSSLSILPLMQAQVQPPSKNPATGISSNWNMGMGRILMIQGPGSTIVKDVLPTVDPAKASLNCSDYPKPNEPLPAFCDPYSSPM